MATSGTASWRANRDQIIEQALRLSGAIGDTQSPTATQITLGANALNALTKGLIAQGMPLWKIQYYDIPLSTFVNGEILIGTGKTLNIIAPVKILNTARKDTTAGTSINLDAMAIDSFFNITPYNVLGTPLQYSYQPYSDYGLLQIWQWPDSFWTQSDKFLSIEYQAPFQDFNVGTDDADFPEYWIEALIYLLAQRLAPRYGMSIMERQDLNAMAKELKEFALSFGDEEASMFVSPRKR